MAAVFEFDPASATRAVRLVDVGLDAIANGIDQLGPKHAIAQINRAQRFLAGLETNLLADHVTADGNTAAAQKLLGDSQTSRRETRRRSRRARANANSGGTLGKRLADGEISEEQADLIADADHETNGTAATDTDFIDAIGSTDPDNGRTIRDNYIAANKSPDDVETEHKRQRRLRRTQSYLSKKHGLGVIAIEGDTIAQQRMRDAIAARANDIYHRDGGRDLPHHQHPRTQAQREYDAAYELLSGLHTRPDGSTRSIRSDAEPTRGDTASRGDRAGATGNKRHTPRATTTAPARPTIVVGLTVDKLTGRSNELATQIGLGHIPDSVLADYATDADIIAALFDRAGTQLWQARLTRHATAAQYIALVLRDQGCVRCGASHTRCHAHHLTPWNAPAKGETNLDNLALLCPTCHHELHALNLTLYRAPTTGHWQTRPATPHETPPKRHHTRQHTGSGADTPRPHHRTAPARE